jgi:hypothetical protein
MENKRVGFNIVQPTQVENGKGGQLWKLLKM